MKSIKIKTERTLDKKATQNAGLLESVHDSTVPKLFINIIVPND